MSSIDMMRYKRVLLVILVFIVSGVFKGCFLGGDSRDSNLKERTLYNETSTWLSRDEVIYFKDKEVVRFNHGFLANIANMGIVPYKKELGIYSYNLVDNQEKLIRMISENTYDKRGTLIKSSPEFLGVIQGMGGLSVRLKDKTILFSVYPFSREAYIYMMDGSGKRMEKIIKGVYPLWSPKGDKFLFERIESTNIESKKRYSKADIQNKSVFSLWVFYLEENREEKLIEDSNMSSVIWDYTGERIIYYNRNSKKKYIVGMNGDKKDYYNLIPRDFSPDGAFMLINNSIYEMATGKPVENANWPNDMSNWIRWSPEGDRILGVRGGIAIIDRSGNNFRILRKNMPLSDVQKK